MVTSRSVSDGNGTCSTKTDEKFQKEKGEERIHVHQVKVLLLCSWRWGAWTLMRELILDTDASVQNGEERVIAYSSFVLTPEQKKYCTTRKELLSKIHQTVSLLLVGYNLHSQNSSLTWLFKFKDPQGQTARWMEELSQYNMVVQQRSELVVHDSVLVDASCTKEVQYLWWPVASASLFSFPPWMKPFIIRLGGV